MLITNRGPLASQTSPAEKTSRSLGRSPSSTLRRVIPFPRLLPVVSQKLIIADSMLFSADFLCELSLREVKAGKIARRPVPSRELPFGDLFETFLMTWSCLNSLG